MHRFTSWLGGFGFRVEAFGVILYTPPPASVSRLARSGLLLSLSLSLFGILISSYTHRRPQAPPAWRVRKALGSARASEGGVPRCGLTSFCAAPASSAHRFDLRASPPAEPPAGAGWQSAPSACLPTRLQQPPRALEGLFRRALLLSIRLFCVDPGEHLPLQHGRRAHATEILPRLA